MNYDKAINDMIEFHLKGRDVSDIRVLKVMEIIPRQDFVPASLKSSAYDDNPLPVGYGQTISQPYIVAIMTELLELKGDEKVLEVGAGSGYQAAILSKLAKKVIGVERVKELAERTKVFLKKKGYKNVTLIHGDGTKGYAKQAPYDAIIITAATPKVPEVLFEQLADNGRLVAPVGPSYHQELIRYKKVKGKLEKDYFGGCIFVPLIFDD